MNGMLQLDPKNTNMYTLKKDAEDLRTYLRRHGLIYTPSKIWFPFNDEGRALHEAFKPVANCIATNTDFFTTSVPCDLIISNPPFSGRTKIFTKLMAEGKPFIMLQSITALNNSYIRKLLLEHHENFTFIFPDHRMSFEGQDHSPSFYSFWLCYKIPNPHTFNDINK